MDGRFIFRICDHPKIQIFYRFPGIFIILHLENTLTMRPFILTVIFIIMDLNTLAQVSISSDGSSPDSKAMLDVRSTTRGFLPPRMNRITLDAITNPPDGLMIFCTDCSPDSTGAMVIRSNGKWFTLTMSCLLPLAPPAGIHASALHQITWNWLPVADAAGYKWNTTNNYNSATDMGVSLTITETGLPCNTAYTRYVWAYNNCGYSLAGVLTQSTAACPPDCGGPFTDPRDGRVYATAWIGSQCWMVQNMNVGIRINGNTNSTNNGIIEKYCYNDLETNCNVYGGLYQWDEMMD